MCAAHLVGQHQEGKRDIAGIFNLVPSQIGHTCESVGIVHGYRFGEKTADPSFFPSVLPASRQAERTSISAPPNQCAA
jgi:hypothetical protein